ncbi:MAG: family 78 glycoside hydrolase catalytic domain, partial [Alistipes sp.]|nr:family 78 glycoside hydrolase catalytic domain [Alistipes sp.]
MKQNLYFWSLSLMMGIISLTASGKQSPTTAPPTTVTGLRCEYAVNPIGMDIADPQLSWRLESSARDVRQTAYQIVVTRAAEDGSTEEVWNTGKVTSPLATAIPYAGAALESRGHYDWRVKVWTNDGAESAWSESAFFEMALMKESDWLHEWIAYAPGNPGRIIYFKGTFCPPQAVSRARLYLSGIGYNEMTINGRKVGDHVLDPVQSNYSKRIYYSTYDVTEYLGKENVLLVAVAPGWYGMPRLRMQMEVTCTDGSKHILTAGHLRAVATGPTMYSTIFDGEIYDARLESEALHQPYVPSGLMDRVWGLAHNADSPGGHMVSQKCEPIKVVDSLIPQKITEPQAGVYVFDTEQNLAGWAQIQVQGKRGDTLRLRFAETLYANGLVNQENLRNAKAMDTYICKGEGVECWEPRFTYHGFRYVQVEGLRQKPQVGMLRVKWVRNAVEPTGTFTCSNELLNRIHHMIVSTEASNLHGVPTDCPQRDERMGWLNDLTVRIEQALYNFDFSRFYAKFLDDVSDTQDPDGTITCVAPYRFGARPADPVSASYLLLAWKSYEFYGNRSILRDHYAGMRAWVDFLASRTENGIVNYSYYGDWSPPTAFAMSPESAVSKDTPGKLMSTGYLYYCASMIAQMAAVLGNSSDSQTYRQLADRTAEAFNREWWNEEQGGYATNNQAANAFALFLGVVSEDRIPRVVKNLAEDVKRHDNHLTTGNLCTKYLLEMLTRYGEKETAYRLATQTTYPSGGYMLENGATTLWERWEYATGDAMNSHNHPMMGSVDSWFYKYLLGIMPDVEQPAFAHFTLQPYVVEDLTFARGTYQTVKGVIRSDWSKTNGQLTWQVSIPANTTATLYVPTRNSASLRESGRSARKAPGLTFLREEGEWTLFEAG